MSRSPEVDKAEEEMERDQRPWLPSSRGTGRGRGIIPTDLWLAESEVKFGRAKDNPGVDPTGYGRPRDDAGAYPMDDLLIHRPVAPWPGSECAAPWAGPGEAGCLDGEGRWVKTGAPTWSRKQKSHPEQATTGAESTDHGEAAAAAAPSGKNAEVQKMNVDPKPGEVSKGDLGKDGARSMGQWDPAKKLTPERKQNRGICRGHADT